MHRLGGHPAEYGPLCKWLRSQSLLIASLSQFLLQHDALYGDQFVCVPKEVLAEEAVAEKAVELWAAADALWGAVAGQPGATQVHRCACVSRLIGVYCACVPVCECDCANVCVFPGAS